MFEEEKINIPIQDGELNYYPAFFSFDESQRFFQELETQIQWRQDTIRVYDRPVKIPRLNAWYGDKDTPYSYSHMHMQLNEWLPPLLAIKERIETASQHRFNGVLANLYRDGQDSVSWHSDDEPELGKNPAIASVSFGANRHFVLKHKKNKALKPVKLELENGSLLIMHGTTQHHWKHQVPKTQRQVGPRINLTFRLVQS